MTITKGGGTYVSQPPRRADRGALQNGGQDTNTHTHTTRVKHSRRRLIGASNDGFQHHQYIDCVYLSALLVRSRWRVLLYNIIQCQERARRGAVTIVIDRNIKLLNILYL